MHPLRTRVPIRIKPRRSYWPVRIVGLLPLTAWARVLVSESVSRSAEDFFREGLVVDRANGEGSQEGADRDERYRRESGPSPSIASRVPMYRSTTAR
jgi:hypothetical protein